MEEDELALLASQGYTYNDAGYIVDSQGAYVSKISIGSESFSSFLTEGEATSHANKSKSAEANGFKSNTNLNATTYEQQEKFLAKQNVDEYLKNPDKTSLNVNSYAKEYFQELRVEEEADEDNLDVAKKNRDDFSEDATISTLAEVAPESIEEFKAVRKELENIRKTNPDVVTNSKEFISDTQKQLDENSWYNPENITLKTTQIIDGIIKMVAPHGAGMGDEESKKRYIELLEKEKTLLAPAKKAKLDLLNVKLAELESTEELSTFSSEYSMGMYAVRQLKKEKAALEASMEESSLFNPFNVNTALSLGSVGWSGVTDKLLYERILQNKLDNNEDLTEMEQKALDALRIVQSSQQLNYNQKGIYEIVEGTVLSAEFMLGGATSRIVGKSLQKGILQGVAKQKLGKALGIAATQGTQVALHSHTYSNAFDRYHGEITFLENEETGKVEAYTPKRLYNTLQTEAKHALDANEIAIETAKTNGNQDEVERLKLQRAEITKQKDNIQELPTAIGSAFYGITEVLKENLAERYAGKLLKNKYTRKLVDNKLGRALSKSKFGQYAAKKNNSFKGVLNTLNKYGGGVDKTGKTIGSLGEEMWEELVVQAIPTYGKSGYDLDEYKVQFSELGEADFYAKVAGQTLLMQGGMGAIGKGLQFTNETKDVRKKRKYFNSIYKQLEDNGLSQSQFNQLLMKTGEGNFSVQEYNNEIQNLRKQNKNGEANELERNKFFNMAMTAMKHNQGAKFKRSLIAAKSNPNLSPESLVNIEAVIAEVNQMESDIGSYEDLHNREDVMDLQSKRRYTQNQVDALNKEIINLQTKEDNKTITAKEVEKKALLESHLKPLEENVMRFDKHIEEQTSYTRQRELLFEEELSRKIVRNLKEIKPYRGVNSREQVEMAVKQESDAMSGRMSQKSRDKVRAKFLINEDKKAFIKKLKNQMDVVQPLAKEEDVVEEAPVVKKPEEVVTPPKPSNADPEVIESTPEADVVHEESLFDGPVIPPPPTPLEEVSGKLLTEAINIEIPEGGVVDNLDDFSGDKISTREGDSDVPDFLLPDSEGNFNDAEIARMANTTKEVYAEYKKEHGTKPTFREHMDNLVSSSLDGDRQAVKSHLQSLGKAWEVAGYGTSNWLEVYNDYYKSVKTAQQQLLEDTGINVELSTDDKKKTDDKTDKVIEENSTMPPSKVADGRTNRPVISSTNKGKTSSVEIKANFSAIEHTVEIETVDGKVTVSRKNAPIPILSKPGYVDFRHLANPDKNNVGDVLGIEVSTEQDWNDIQVAVRDQNGLVTSTISFANWVVKSTPKGMSIEEFKTTSTFIEKVPMAYKDSQGNLVAQVAEVDWYTPFTTVDETQGKDAVIDINNISPAHQGMIDEARDNARAYRNEIVDGKVSRVTIKVKSQSPLIKIEERDEDGNEIPPKTLSEVANDSPVLFYSPNGKLIDIDGTIVESEHVTNMHTYSEPVVSTDTKTGLKSSSPVGAGSTFYLSHIATEGGDKKYLIIPVLRKNEKNENKVNQEDLETVKWLFAANRVLKYPGENGVSTDPNNPNNLDHAYHLTVDEANNIKQQMMSELGLSVEKDLFKVQQALLQIHTKPYIAELIKSKEGKSAVQVQRIDKRIKKVLKGDMDLEFFMDTRANFVQNMSIHFGNKAIPKIEKSENGIVVSKASESYDEHLKKRLSTNVMGYNLGTESEPKWTTSVQPTVHLEPIRVNKTKEEITEEVKTEPETKKEIKDVVEEVESTDAITTEQETAIANAVAVLSKMNVSVNTEVSDDLLVGELEGTETLEGADDSIDGLQIQEEHDLIPHLIHMINKVGLDDVQATFTEIYTVKKEELTAQVELLNSIGLSNNPKVASILEALNNTINDVNNVIAQYPKLIAKASDIAARSLFITDAVIEEDVVLNEKDYNKSSGEAKPIDKVGPALKKIFSQIPNGETGYLGTPLHSSFKSMYDTSIAILSSDIHKASNFQEMMNKLMTYEEAFNWIKPLVKELKNSPQEIQNQFVYNSYKQAVKAKFAVIVSRSKTEMDSALWNSNANSASLKVQEAWGNSFKRSTIVDGDNINTTTLTKLFDEWNAMGGSEAYLQDDKVIRTWLSKFGITLSDKAWESIKRGELNTKQLKQTAPTSYQELFQKGEGNLFFNLAKYAAENRKRENYDYVDNVKEHPFYDMNSILKNLSILESKYNPVYISTTRRVGGKTMSEVESMTYFYEKVNKLISSALDDKAYIKELQQLSFSENSMLLDLLDTNSNFAEIFESSFLDIVAFKELYKKDPMFASIEDLSSVDYMFVQRTMFQDRKQEIFEGEYNGFKMRYATIGTPTNSDKGRMMMLKTAVFDLYANSETAFTFTEDSAEFTENLKEVLFNQLIEPEVKRAMNSGNTNIKGYDKGAGRINLIPGLNSLEGKSGVKLQEYLHLGKTMAEFKEEFFDLATAHIQENIVTEARENASKIGDFIGNGLDTFNNTNYLKQRTGTIQENMLASELDYIINSMISNMNVFQTIAGDPALYYKSSEDVNNLDENVQTTISEELGINLGKRLAAMIAPGDPIANSKDKKYMQVFLEDPVDIAQNIKSIIEWHYGKKALSEVYEGDTFEKHIEDVLNGTLDVELKDTILDAIKERFSKVADFLDIESADAQEYTTVSEHIEILFGQGRITKDKYNTVRKKIRQQQRAEAKGKTIPKKALLDTVNKNEDGLTELDLILQPIKPVYTGSVVDINQDVNRMMYIKSSSFPLIPQLTIGRELDGLRKKMEELEQTNKMPVRASYQTANKVGAMTNPINPFDEASLATLGEVETLQNGEVVPSHYLVLNREDLKIQQDVPFKSKIEKVDKVSMGTQIFKLLFGDGIMEIGGFKLDGETLTGKELQAEFFNVFSEMVGIQKDTLLTKLGLDSNMESQDKEKTARIFQNLIEKEAKDRGFSSQDIKALQLHESVDVNGDKFYHFKMPLWFSGNSDKYESMFNAIINNKIFKQKIPGNAFVAGSEAGFKLSSDLSDVNLSRVIHVGDYEGTTLKGATTESAQSEALLPSKFKLNGVLIDLFEDFNDVEGKYLERDGNGILRIKEGMIDAELLEQFAFRIPTSSHGLGSSIKVVGFLPPESGDLIVTPKNFITQMGQDFDIDKLTSYQYNHIVMPDGAIKMLNEETKEVYIEAQENAIAEEYDKLRAEDKDGKAVTRMIEAIFGITLEENFTEDIGNNKKKIERALSENFDLKLAENKFIKIHNAVFTNPKVQPQINKVLSVDLAKSQAQGIAAIVNRQTNSFNILSPNYQMKKMDLGSTGQDAIGIYAKGVTFHSLVQQSTSHVRMEQSGERGTTPKFYQIGNVTSDGKFGKSHTLPSKNSSGILDTLRRRISQVLDERTNTGTDNEKEQVLGRVGLNYSDGIAVDNLLALLGFDTEVNNITKAEYDASNPFHDTAFIDGKQRYFTQYSIPYLLHSQPIIKEYFERVSMKESTISSEFTVNAKEVVIEELLKENAGANYEFLNGELFNNTTGEVEQNNGDFTTETLLNQLKEGGSSPKLQIQILALYTDLISDAKKVKEVMALVDSSNLGKSMWESSIKAKDFKNLLLYPELTGLEGTGSLLGITRIGNGDIQEGELDLGENVFFTPTTNQGVMVGTAYSLSENLFNEYFPAKDTYINEVINDIVQISSVNGDNTFALIEAKQQIFQEVKKYITAAKHNGIYNVDSKTLRESLYVDTKSSQSLSTYIGNLFESESVEYETGVNKIKSNRFLSTLSYVKGEKGKPSLIKFNNTEARENSEEHIYDAFRKLFLEDVALPPRNGESFSTRQLAQELVAYSFAGGGLVQKAIQFHKYIPLEYFDDLTTLDTKGNPTPVTRFLQSYDTIMNDWGKVLPNGKQRLTDFSEQYFQNNPEKAIQYSIKESKALFTFMKGGNFSTDRVDADETKYISIKQRTKSKLKADNFRLYKHVGNGLFERIDVLGDTGMSEYQYGIINLKSSLRHQTGEAIAPNHDLEIVVQPKKSEDFGIKEGAKVSDILTDIVNTSFGGNDFINDMARSLQTFDDNTITIKVIDDANQSFVGKASENTIELNAHFLKDKTTEDLAQTFLHEYVHTLTSKIINENLDENGNIKLDSIKEIAGLNNVFSNYRKQLEAKYPEEYRSFINKYNTHLENKGKKLGDKIPVKFSPREVGVFYPAVNIKEFIATTLGNNIEFIKEASEMTYLKSNLNILEKFGKFIVDLLDRIKGQDSSVAREAIVESLSFIESIKTPLSSNFSTEQEITEADMKWMKEQAIADQQYYQTLSSSEFERVNKPENLPAINRTKKECK